MPAVTPTTPVSTEGVYGTPAFARGQMKVHAFVDVANNDTWAATAHRYAAVHKIALADVTGGTANVAFSAGTFTFTASATVAFNLLVWAPN